MTSVRPLRRRHSPRTALLLALRQQRIQIDGATHFSASDAPDLYALSRAADQASRGRQSFNFRGVRFPLRFGLLRRYVIDPDTGNTLIAGGLLG